MAYEVLPKEVYENNVFNTFEISYKRQIKLHNTVKCYYSFEEDTHKIIIKSLDNKTIHAIISLKP